MIGHTMAKLYATILKDYTSQLLDARGFRLGGQEGFRRDHCTIDHILTLQAIIEEANFWKTPIFSCFVVFRKAFDTILIHRLMDIIR